MGLIRFRGRVPTGGYDAPYVERKCRRQSRRFIEDFKAQAVRLVLHGGKSVGAVAPYDLTECALRHSLERTRADQTGLTGLTTLERD